MTNITKEEICSLYFNDTIKPKHLREFEIVTPNNNVVRGYINRKPNQYLGSLYIFSLNGFDTSQFVYSMPKINYIDNSPKLSTNGGYQEYFAYEKLDGSCLILYPLLQNGKVIEIIPKSRNTPIADKFLLNMFKLVDQKRILYFFKENANTTLLFELFGVLNKHEILYPKTYIDIRLIGATRESEVLTDKEIDKISLEYNFDRPDLLFHIIHFKGRWRFYKCTDFQDIFYYLPESKEVIYYPNQMDCINAIADLMQEVNNNYYKDNQRILLEGCVINGIDDNQRQLYIKIKPWDILERLRYENGIPRRFIVKEMRKYFDEYRDQINALYQEDENCYLEYIRSNLLEEFDEKYVMSKSTRKKIKSVFFDVWESLTPPAGIQEIARELIDKYPNDSVSDIMRHFAIDYPQMKNKAKMVYSVVSAIKGV